MKQAKVATSIRHGLVAVAVSLAPLALAHADTFGSGNTAPVVRGSIPMHVPADTGPAPTPTTYAYELLNPQPAPRGMAGPLRADPPAYRGGDGWNLQERALQRRLGDLGAGTP